MSIQSNINQVFSLAGLLFSQTETAKHLQQVNRAKSDVAKRTKMFDIATADMESLPATASESTEALHASLYDEALGSLEEAETRLFHLNPTAKGYKDILTTREGREEMKVAVEESKATRAEKRKKAEEKAAEAGAEEARRLAISRSITEGVYSTDPAFDPRYTGGKKK